MSRENLSQLYVFTAIIILSLLVRVFIPDSYNFIDAIYATMSLPVVYTMSYYTRRASGDGDFVRRKDHRTSVVYEAMALMASYMVGFFMYYSLTGDTDVFIYTLAYISSQTMRLSSIYVIRTLRTAELDPEHPFLVLLCSGLIAGFHLALLKFLLQSL